jgi:hypothetical protein
MGSPPEENRLPEKSPFEIPEPSSDPLLAVATCDDEATSEFLAFSQSTDEAWKRYVPRMDWRLRRIFRIILFVFVLLINLTWSVAIIVMLWKSARIGGSFHLSDSVLVALVSTSIANFLGLVVIVARHLFPAGSST